MLFTSTFISLIVIANILTWKSLTIGIIFGFTYLFWNGYLLGKAFFKREQLAIQLLVGSFLILAVISLLGTAAYYPYKLTNQITAIILFIIPLIINAIQKAISQQTNKLPIPAIAVWLREAAKYSLKIKGFLWRFSLERKTELKKFSVYCLLLTTYTGLMIYCWLIVYLNITDQAINSLWQVLPLKFLAGYFLCTLVLIIITTTKKQRGLNLMLVRSHAFLTVGLALFIYQIGYGFDPFIHQAAEKVISVTGIILPKTVYYIGQYSLVVNLSRLLQLPTSVVDAFLLPLLFSAFIPTFIYLVYRKVTGENLTVIDPDHEEIRQRSIYYFLPLVILLFPLADFIATTPQGLANFFALIIIIGSSLLISKNVDHSFSYLLLFLSFVTVAIHPLTGIPILFFSIILFFSTYRFQHNYWRKVVIIFIILASLISLPGAFFIQNFSSPHIINNLTLEKINWTEIKNAFSVLAPSFDNKFRLLDDYFHFFGDNVKWLTIVFGAIGYYLINKKKDDNKESKYYLYPLFFLLLLADYFSLRIFIDWQSVINYEQNDYALRLFNLSFYFLFPLALYSFYELTHKILRQKMLVKIFFGIIFALLITANLYLSYPHSDAYQISHFYSTSRSDILAVSYMEQNTTGNYIVLANQSTSAAVLKIFGFKKYYKTTKGEIFYYPIPTSGPLYKIYLEMVYGEPTRKKMIQAMDTVGVNQGYFVINKYWNDFDKITSEIMTQADSWQEIDNGNVHIFYFKR
ncbi:MAG: hypothetical protein WC310_03615 [Patescibacteria group bacterium]